MASSANGACFIKTSSLDGEKNLKKRQQPKDFDLLVPNTQQEASKALASLKGSTFTSEPNKNLH
jgi:hypothetical protein